MLPSKVNENWETFPTKKQSLEREKILLSINQIAVNMVSQWWIKMWFKKIQSLLIKDIFKLLAGASSCKRIHDMQVELIFDIIYIVHQILHLPAYSLSPSRHRIYPNFQTTFHMRRKSSFEPWSISVECIIVLTEEVENILYLCTPVWFEDT